MNSLVKSIEEMSDEELLARLQQTRHNREVDRPVAKRKAASAEKKASTKRTNAVAKMLEGLSEEDKAALLKQLEGSE